MLDLGQIYRGQAEEWWAAEHRGVLEAAARKSFAINRRDVGAELEMVAEQLGQEADGLDFLPLTVPQVRGRAHELARAFRALRSSALRFRKRLARANFDHKPIQA